MKTTTEMRVNRKMAFADPKAARKSARSVKLQAELRLRLTKAIQAAAPGLHELEWDMLADAVIEELKK